MTEKTEAEEKLIPEADIFVKNTLTRLRGPGGAEFSTSRYGHAAGVLAQGILTNENLPPEQQRENESFCLTNN